jgi:hypothetical protein
MASDSQKLVAMGVAAGAIVAVYILTLPTTRKTRRVKKSKS